MFSFVSPLRFDTQRDPVSTLFSPPAVGLPFVQLFRLVLETLKPLPGDRKCFRMINGVLVERTVDGVLPALQTNSDGLKKVLDELVKQYKRQQEEMEKWKVRWSPYPAFISQIVVGELGCSDIWLE